MIFKPDQSLKVNATTAAHNLTDEKLMREFKGGSDTAFNTLVLRWQPPIKRFLYRMLQKTHETEDLTQEVFLRIFTKKDQFKDNAPFSSWIYSIANNLARNHYRTTLRWGWIQPMSDDECWEIIESLEPTPSNVSERQEKVEKVKKAIASLEKDVRSTVILFYYEKLSVQEIGASLGFGVKAIEMKLYRARQKLKSELDFDN